MVRKLTQFSHLPVKTAYGNGISPAFTLGRLVIAMPGDYSDPPLLRRIPDPAGPVVPPFQQRLTGIQDVEFCQGPPGHGGIKITFGIGLRWITIFTVKAADHVKFLDYLKKYVAFRKAARNGESK